MTIRIEPIKPNLNLNVPASKDDIAKTREEIKAIQKSIAGLQSCVAKIISFLESEAQEKRKRRHYIEVGYRG